MQESASKLEARFWMNRACIFFIFKPRLEIFSLLPIDSTIHIWENIQVFFLSDKNGRICRAIMLTKEIVLYELAFYLILKISSKNSKTLRFRLYLLLSLLLSPPKHYHLDNRCNNPNNLVISIPE